MFLANCSMLRKNKTVHINWFSHFTETRYSLQARNCYHCNFIDLQHSYSQGSRRER